MSWNFLLMDLLAVLAALFAWRGIRIFSLFVRSPEHEDALFFFYRGAQRLLIAAGLLFLAAGIFWDVRWLIWFGAIFLAEEIYESGVVLLILNWDKKNKKKESEENSIGTKNA